MSKVTDWLTENWAKYKSGDYNDIGKLNIVANIGERTPAILAELQRLEAENRDLLALVRSGMVKYPSGEWTNTELQAFIAHAAVQWSDKAFKVLKFHEEKEAAQ